MTRLTGLVLLALVGCAKAEPPTPQDHKLRPSEEALAQLPEREPAGDGDDHALTASELPLTEDFTAAAAKRVTPDNYRKELVTIERELQQLAGKR